MEKATKLSPDNAPFIIELGHQQLLMGNLKGAATSYKTALKLDESENALHGNSTKYICLAYQQKDL
jgi:hypothetical protein